MKINSQTLVTILALLPFLSLMLYGVVTTIIDSFREYGAVHAAAMWLIMAWLLFGVAWLWFRNR